MAGHDDAHGHGHGHGQNYRGSEDNRAIIGFMGGAGGFLGLLFGAFAGYGFLGATPFGLVEPGGTFVTIIIAQVITIIIGILLGAILGAIVVALANVFGYGGGGH